MAVLAELSRVVFVNRNADGFQRAACGRQSLPFPLHGLVFPPVVIAKHRMHTERRLQAGEHPRPIGIGNEACHVAMTGHIVAEHDDDVGLERIGAFDDRLDMIERHPGIAGMEVGDRGDPEFEP